MTKENKELLLIDLCARLPYFTKVQIKNEIVILDSICNDDGYHFNFIGGNREGVNIEEIKPYLFPLSSMTEEQFEKFSLISGWDVDIEDVRQGKFSCIGYIGFDCLYDPIDWFNKNHFDWRGLIPKGLAIDATGKGIYKQKSKGNLLTKK